MKRTLLGIVGVGVGGAVAIVGWTTWRIVDVGNHDDRRPADAIVVLGAAQYNGRPSAILKARLDHAIELYEAGLAPYLVVTGGKAEGDRTTEAASARLGMAVSRRVSKLAVVRNRIRRQIRETFRLQRAGLPCFDVLIIARTTAATQDNRVLREELLQLWRRLASMPWTLPSRVATSNGAPLNEAPTPGTMRGPTTS